MMKFFFETSAYNHLLKYHSSAIASVREALNTNKIYVCSIEQVLGELSDTINNNATWGMKLCEVFFDITSFGVPNPPKLLWNELCCFLDGVENKVFFRISNDPVTLQSKTKFLAGNLSQEDRKWGIEYKAGKKRHHSSFKEKNRGTLVNSKGLVLNYSLTFEDFWKDLMQNGELRGLIADNLLKLLHENNAPALMVENPEFNLEVQHLRS